jgi:hypothetical protein
LSLFDGWNIDSFLPCFWQMDNYSYATLGVDGWYHCDGLHRPGFLTLLSDVLHYFGYTGTPAYRGRPYHEFRCGCCKVHMDIPAHPSDPGMTAWFTTARCDNLDDTLERAVHQALMEFHGSSTILWFWRTLNFTARLWMKLITLGILSIQEPTRCIKIWRRISGGQEWRGKLWNMYQTVTHVKESKLIIWGHPETHNHWAFPSGNRKTSAWTSLWVYPAPHMGTTWYGSLWTAWLWQPTLYPYPPLTGLPSTPSSIYHTLFAIMASWRPLSSVEDLSSLLAFGNNCINAWAPILSEAHPIILKLTDKLSESIKSLKIFFMLVFWLMVWNGTSTFH